MAGSLLVVSPSASLLASCNSLTEERPSHQKHLELSQSQSLTCLCHLNVPSHPFVLALTMNASDQGKQTLMTLDRSMKSSGKESLKNQKRLDCLRKGGFTAVFTYRLGQLGLFFLWHSSSSHLSFSLDNPPCSNASSEHNIFFALTSTH